MSRYVFLKVFRKAIYIGQGLLLITLVNRTQFRLRVISGCGNTACEYNALDPLLLKFPLSTSEGLNADKRNAG